MSAPIRPSRKPEVTAIGDDGLRYVSKTPGSPFGSTSSYSAATMSCFLCSRHRPRAMLMSRKYFGRSQSVCAPACEPRT
ncbi:MAG: hypothetical protein EPO01_16860 [Aquabacterium sp.]|nr:MAG: hypothetical protein EPO01_16860 [Aquabacterium sp.]